MKTTKKHTFLDYYRIINPCPVINFDKKLAVFFSAKSGCTFVVKWFFFQINHLDAALDFKHFVHQYRGQVYMKSAHYIKSRKDFISKKGRGYLKIKIVRNPFERAVSSYIHFLGMVKNKDPEIKSNFGIECKKQNFSFNEFLNLLLTVNIRRCNIHWRQQYQFIERRLNMNHIIHLKKSMDELLNLEQKYSLSKTKDMANLSHSKHHSFCQKSNISQQFCGDVAFSFEVKRNRPEYKYFYNDRLLEKVRRIYQVDFEQYNFDLTYL